MPFNGVRLIAVIQAYAERIAKPDKSLCGKPHGACIAVPCKPSQVNTTTPDFRSDETRDVVSAFAPVEAWSAENSSVPGRRCEFRDEAREKFLAGVCHLATILIEDDVSLGNKHIGDSHPKPASQMIVAVRAKRNRASCVECG